MAESWKLKAEFAEGVEAWRAGLAAADQPGRTIAGPKATGRNRRPAVWVIVCHSGLPRRSDRPGRVAQSLGPAKSLGTRHGRRQRPAQPRWKLANGQTLPGRVPPLRGPQFGVFACFGCTGSIWTYPGRFASPGTPPRAGCPVCLLMVTIRAAESTRRRQRICRADGPARRCLPAIEGAGNAE